MNAFDEGPALPHAVPAPPSGAELWQSRRPRTRGHRFALAEPRRGDRRYSADRERGNLGAALHSEPTLPD